MADQQYTGMPDENSTQLSQASVPLTEAAEAFNTKDAGGRSPIVVRTTRQNRLNNTYMITALIVLVGGITWGLIANNALIITAAGLIALALAAFAIYRSFYVTIPEGTSGLITTRGKYLKTVEPGLYVFPPWYLITHLVTRREIPFDVPITDAPTADNVRAIVDALVTFTITDPYRFVYSLSASDFDRVFQASCQTVLRTIIRGIESSQVHDLTGRDTTDLQAALNTSMEAYGVAIRKVNITYARPPAEFMLSEEARRLATVQQIEQAERQALARRRQADQEELALQAVLAQTDREREATAARKRIIELEAEAETLRLTRLQERLQEFPVAAQWDVETAQLDIARGLASNPRAVVQVGNTGEIARAFTMSDVLKEANIPPTDGTNSTGAGHSETAITTPQT
jgi:regulator of protease activity HflC (stomatin/prohibitin superfamily)